MDVQAAYDKLVENLQNLVKSYRVLLDQVRREKDHLLQCEIQELNTLNQEKAVILNKIGQYEQTRVRLAAELSDQVGYEERPIRLLELARLLPEDQADSLRTLHSTLDLLLKRVMEINKSNAQLAESALRFTTDAMDHMKQNVRSEKPTYQRKGQIQQGKDPAGHFVSKEV